MNLYWVKNDNVVCLNRLPFDIVSKDSSIKSRLFFFKEKHFD
jgi:hypothetical protein